MNNKNYQKRIVVLILFFVATISNAQKEIKPLKFLTTVQLTGPSDFIYYALSEKVKTALVVEGPGELTLYNRVRLNTNEKESKPYFLKYTLNNKMIISKKIGPQTASQKIKYKSTKVDGVPSVVDKVIIKIPPGKHKLNFYKCKTDQKVHVRFMYKQEIKTNWKEIKTKNDLKQVVILNLKSKKTQNYSRIDNFQRFKFSTNEDNSKIRVFLRADFNYKMHSQNVCRVILKENGKNIATYKITCHKSKVVENKTDKKLIPGSLEKLYIDIPVNGKHNFELLLKEPNQSALVRVFIDESEVSKK